MQPGAEAGDGDPGPQPYRPLSTKQGRRSKTGHLLPTGGRWRAGPLPATRSPLRPSAPLEGQAGAAAALSAAPQPAWVRPARMRTEGLGRGLRFALWRSWRSARGAAQGERERVAAGARWRREGRRARGARLLAACGGAPRASSPRLPRRCRALPARSRSLRGGWAPRRCRAEGEHRFDGWKKLLGLPDLWKLNVALPSPGVRPRPGAEGESRRNGVPLSTRIRAAVQLVKLNAPSLLLTSLGFSLLRCCVCSFCWHWTFCRTDSSGPSTPDSSDFWLGLWPYLGKWIISARSGIALVWEPADCIAGFSKKKKGQGVLLPSWEQSAFLC